MTSFAVRYTYADRPERLDAVRPEHRAFLRSLLEAGTLLASGPLVGPSTEQAAGEDGHEGDAAPGALLLLRGRDVAEVLSVLDDDPFARESLVAHRSVRRWDPVIGPFAS
ncbi:YciI family protein [Actinotalea sp. AC32]|nr:YciI family protein [Actinotalea sp. AC32]